MRAAVLLRSSPSIRSVAAGVYFACYYVAVALPQNYTTASDVERGSILTSLA